MLDYLDVVIMGVYLSGTVLTGILFRGRQQDINDYFLAGRGMGSAFQSVLVGLSLAAAMFSGISFLAFPSVVYSDGIGMLLAVLFLPLMYFILRYWFLPVFFTINNDHPYGFIEKKLGPTVRTFAAGMYVLLRIGWMAALIYAPTVAIIAAAGLSSAWLIPLILVIGISSSIYTTIGGIRGVIVTEALQFVIIAVGIAFTIGLILFRIPADVGAMAGFLKDSDSLKLFDFSLDPTKVFTVWSIGIGMTISRCGQFMADQMSLQRYIASGDVRASSRSFLINVFGSMSVTALLVLVGLLIKAWYHFVPDPNLPEKADKVFPYFAATQLPRGLTGVVLAALLAATVSSMTSGINTLAATITLDFKGRYWKPQSKRADLVFAKVISGVLGGMATLMACFVGKLGTIFEITQSLLGVFLGPLFGCVVFALVNRRISQPALILGMIGGAGCGIGITFSEVSNIWVAAVSFFVTVIITSLGSALRVLRT